MNEEQGQTPEKPKIIVDDDWKSRAQAEKEQLQQEAEAKQRGDAAEPQPPGEDIDLPPASFPVLVTTLATQTISLLGQLPGPEGKPVVQLNHAKHFIDTLAVLEEKTKGNLTSEESAMLTNVLHELRMLYVQVKDRPPQPEADSQD